MINRTLIYLATLVFSNSALAGDWRSSFIAALKNGSVFAETSSGKSIIKSRPNDPMIPASTMKVATSFCALENLGRQYRYTTDFYVDKDSKLFIKGIGDPALVSEDLAPLAAELARKILKVSKIVVDDSAFEKDITIDGSSNSQNPYDAPPGAFIVNFNTIIISKSSSGVIASGEPQTPLTPLSRKLARDLPVGTTRINIGKDTQKGALYGAELLAAFLRQAGVKVNDEIDFGDLPKDVTHIHTYHSTKTLSETVQGLLKFSTNFSANQLYLTLGAKKFGYPANDGKAKKALFMCLQENLGWDNFSVGDGAGLSRKNQISAVQMVRLLRAFEPYRDLLSVEKVFQAKTGTLTGVNTYIGYFPLPSNDYVRFAILVNSPVTHDYKFQMASKLYRGVVGSDP